MIGAPRRDARQFVTKILLHRHTRRGCLFTQTLPNEVVQIFDVQVHGQHATELVEHCKPGATGPDMAIHRDSSPGDNPRGIPLLLAPDHARYR